MRTLFVILTLFFPLISAIPSLCLLCEQREGFHCIFTDDGPECVSDVIPRVCNLLCEIGKHCEITPSGPRCVPDDDCDHHPPSCGENEEYRRCGNHCEGKCSQVGDPDPHFCILICGPPACACKKGFYRNYAGECVTKCECKKRVTREHTTSTLSPSSPCDFKVCDFPTQCEVLGGNAVCVAPQKGG